MNKKFHNSSKALKSQVQNSSSFDMQFTTCALVQFCSLLILLNNLLIVLQDIVLLAKKLKKASVRFWHTCGWTLRSSQGLAIMLHPPHPLRHRQHRKRVPGFSSRENWATFLSTRSNQTRHQHMEIVSELVTVQFCSMASDELLIISN